MNGWRWFLGAALAGIAVGVANATAFAQSGGQGTPARVSPAQLCWTEGDMQLAATTERGAEIWVGQTGMGTCLSYRDRHGVTGTTVSPLGATPAGPAVTLKALDVDTGEYVVVAVVPDGYRKASVLGNAASITNNVLVIDARDARDGMTIQGPSGVEKINLGAFRD